MNVIFKYPVSDELPVTTVKAPIIKPLKVDYQGMHSFLWAIVDLDKASEEYDVFRVGTGHMICEKIVPFDSYLNSTVAQSEPYVWHWFCAKSPDIEEGSE